MTSMRNGNKSLARGRSRREELRGAEQTRKAAAQSIYLLQVARQRILYTEYIPGYLSYVFRQQQPHRKITKRTRSFAHGLSLLNSTSIPGARNPQSRPTLPPGRLDKRSTNSRTAWGLAHVVLDNLYLKDEKTLKRNGPIPLYYKSLYGL